METRQRYEIRRTIKSIKEYIKTLTILEEQQTDIADKILFEKMKLKLLVAIKNLEYQLEKEEEPVRLTTTVWTSSAIKKFHTNYLPGSTCYVLQDNAFYILDTNHEWVKI